MTADEEKQMQALFAAGDPAARLPELLPQRVAAELSDSRLTRTFSRCAKTPQRSSKMRRAWRCSQLCTTSRICAGSAVGGRPRCRRRVSAFSTAPVARPSSCTVTGAPRKGICVPSRQSTRAASTRSVMVATWCPTLTPASHSGYSMASASGRTRSGATSVTNQRSKSLFQPSWPRP